MGSHLWGVISDCAGSRDAAQPPTGCGSAATPAAPSLSPRSEKGIAYGIASGLDGTPLGRRRRACRIGHAGRCRARPCRRLQNLIHLCLEDGPRVQPLARQSHGHNPTKVAFSGCSSDALDFHAPLNLYRVISFSPDANYGTSVNYCNTSNWGDKVDPGDFYFAYKGGYTISVNTVKISW